MYENKGCAKSSFSPILFQLQEEYVYTLNEIFALDRFRRSPVARFQCPLPMSIALRM